jgi:hypothetical protein
VVGIDDPAMQDALTQYHRHGPKSRGSRTADIDRAMWLGLGAGGVVFLVALVLAIVRLTRHRLAFVFPLLGCVAQLALAIGAAAMEWQAGPIS